MDTIGILVRADLKSMPGILSHVMEEETGKVMTYQRPPELNAKNLLHMIAILDKTLTFSTIFAILSVSYLFMKFQIPKFNRSNDYWRFVFKTVQLSLCQCYLSFRNIYLKILLIGYLIGNLLMIAIFRNSLRTNLVVVKYPRVINNIEEMVDEEEFKPLFVKNSAITNVFKYFINV